jgi:transposase InsO family protein
LNFDQSYRLNFDQGRIQISMDGKGCWRDNGFVERLWKSIKYEEVCLHAYDSVSQAEVIDQVHRVPQRPANAHQS